MSALLLLLAFGAAVCTSAATIRATQIEDLSAEDQFVLTPFGWWHKSCVHGVDSGSHITNERNHISIDLPEYGINVEVQRCPYMHNATEIADKMTNMEFYRNSVSTTSRSTKPTDSDVSAAATATGSGWQQYTKMDAGSTVDGFYGYWPVPTSPVGRGQTLFMFTGLQNIDWVPPQPPPTEAFDIIQPVLQFGGSAAGGGHYWTCGSWYVTLGRDVVYSRLERVSDGEQLFGNMTKTNDDTWYINCFDEKTEQSSAITVSKSLLTSQPWVYVTLEVYQVVNCDQYPPPGTPLPFTQLLMTEGGQPTNIQWVVGKDGQQPGVCNSSVAILSDKAVTITF